jgi:hypothetical protein
VPPVRLFRPENALEDALLAGLEDGDVDRFLVALGDADVYVPAADEETPPRGGALQLPVVDVDGEQLVPIFTSLTQLARFRPHGTAYLGLPGAALATGDVGVVVNPGGDLGLTLTPAQLSRLGTVAPEAADAELLIGEPREEPLALLDAMRRFAADRPDILAAYRAMLVRRAGSPEPVIGLELRRGADARASVEAAAAAAADAGIERLALLALDPDVEPDRIGRFLLERTQPFWTRAS